MEKIVFIKFVAGDFEKGFKVNLLIGEKDNFPFTETIGYLSPQPILLTLLQKWQEQYKNLFGEIYRKIKVQHVYHYSSEDCAKSASKLQYCFINWLQSKEFREIDIRLREELNPNEQIRIVICTQDKQLRQLPWHLWDLFERYSKAELALSFLESRKDEKYNTPTYRDKVKILAILGNSTGINVEKDRQILENLPDAATTCLSEPQRYDINEHLWNQTWDILFFAGHGLSEGQKGRIYINQNDSLTIEELKYGLKQAVANGLQLAIFNSCAGLSLIHELEELHIPQIIVMREPVPDKVAQEFLKYFLVAFATDGKSLYQAVREARLRLHGLEDKYPYASWLPAICQNPATIPPSWLELGRRDTNICPYRGLFAFREEHSRFFFGRETFTKMLVNAVTDPHQSFIGVVGSSGSGKSSVVFAGLVKQLRDTGEWLILDFRPGSRPLFNLATAVVSQQEDNLSYYERSRDIRNLTTDLQNSENVLRDIIDSILSEQPNRRFLLVVDQFEELYTLCKDLQERKIFLDRLSEVVKDNPRFTLVITLRADFLGEALSYRPFADLLQHADLKLGPMTYSELQATIEKPAELLGVTIEENLVERILSELSPENLPLLEFALSQLWARQQDAELTHAAYTQIGGVEAALANYAGDIYKQLNFEQQERAQRIFIQLVHPSLGTQDTRRIATRKEIGAENWDLVARLADARLVVTGYDEKANLETVEIVHEALILNWGQLREWMYQGREFRYWQEHLRVAMLTWKNSNYDEGALLRGKPLRDAEDWQSKRNIQLGEQERSFIGLSVELREREHNNQKRRRRFTIFALSAGLLTVFSLTSWQWRIAEFERKIVQIKNLSNSSKEHLFSNQDFEALIEAIKAGKLQQELVDKTAFDTRIQVVTLLEQTIYQLQEGNRLKKNSGWIIQVQLSPDNKKIASVSKDKTVKLWSREGKLLNTLKSDNYEINSISFSPDGKTIASGSYDGTVTLWDISTSRKIRTFKEHTSNILGVSFSPDGKKIASADRNGSIQLWSIDGTLTRTLRQNNSPVESISFSPDGQLIASANADKTIRLWKLNGTLLATLRGHSDIVNSANFSPNGHIITSASDDNTVKLWRLDGILLKTLQGHNDGVTSVSFSPDGKLLASGSKDSTIIFWNLDLNNLLIRGCDWVRDYLKNSPNQEVQIQDLCKNVPPE